MRILSVEQGVFPEIERLNLKFRPGHRKLKVRLDTRLENTILGELHPLMPERFRPFFPSLHARLRDDGGSSRSRYTYGYMTSSSLVRLHGNSDLAYYIEQLVLGVLQQLGGPELPCAITMPVVERTSEHLLFVECAERQLGVFSMNYVMALMHQALYCGELDPRYRPLLPMAKWLRERGNAPVTAAEAAEHLAVSLAQACYCLQAINVFHLSASPVLMRDSRDARRLGPVLIIEDDDLSRELLCDVLHDLGYTAIVAPDGKEGLRQLCRYEAQTVMLDIALPDANGIAIARWLLESQPSLKIILMSGQIETESGGPYSDGVFGVLPKPFTVDALEKLLER